MARRANLPATCEEFTPRTRSMSNQRPQCGPMHRADQRGGGIMVTSEFIPDSAGARFGSVIRTRHAGEFLLRLSRYGAGVRLPMHHHPRAYFCFVARGCMEERIGASEHRFDAGSVHFHPPLDPHSGRIGPDGTTCLSIIPLGALADRYLLDEGLHAAPNGVMRWAAARCYRAFREDDDPSRLCTEAAALELVAALLRQSDGGSRTPRWLPTVRSHLDRGYMQPIQLRDLAVLAGVHAVYLARAFRRHM